MDSSSPAATARRAGDAGTVNKAWLRALELTGAIERAPERTLPIVVEEEARRRPEAPALLSDEAQLTYGELAGLMRRYARWARAAGLRKGEVVALMAHNQPQYLAAWLGLARAGVVIALLNTSLRGEPLAHSLAAASPRLLITTGEFAAACAEAAQRQAQPPQIWRMDDAAERGLEAALAALPDAPLAPGEAEEVTVGDPALLIYTSGTTGLPKAAWVSHRRVMSWSCWFAGMLDVGDEDRLYDCLPMYHSVGGVVAPGALLARGGSVVIARRFSASRFWDDIARWDCTMFQYIGELCRYLTRAAPSENERRHRLRVACGNGLRGDVWREFQARTGIPRIVEFYAATEGNFSLFNVEGEPGAIGRIPGFMRHRFPLAIVALDPRTDEPLRDPDGRCRACACDEAGEAIARISSRGEDPAHRFEGYTSAADTEKKVLRDVFAPGDAWLRSGDLMRRDARGFFYFVDRLGDSFRWKGENISALEVTQALEACPGVEAAAVYGVAAPHAEGRVGMATLVVRPEFSLAQLRSYLADTLPSYARPAFIRIADSLPATETFKTASRRLAADGFDPGGIRDPLYVEDPAAQLYAPLDPAVFAKIAAGELRL